MNQAERLNWQKRVEFYGKKMEQYDAKYYPRYPSHSTVRRWHREFERSGTMIIEFVPRPALRKAVFGLRDTTGQFRAFCYKLKTGYGVDIIVKGKPRNGAQFNEAKEAKSWAREQLMDLIEWAV